MPSVRSSFITFLGTLLLVGCGLKGPLYLPDDKAKDSKKETREVAASFQAHGILLTTRKPAA